MSFRIRDQTVSCWRKWEPAGDLFAVVPVEVTAVMLDLERRLAITALLAQPDPPELRRAHRLRLAGKPERFELVPQLSAVFVQAKLLALHERWAETNEAHARCTVSVQAPQRLPWRIAHRAA